LVSGASLSLMPASNSNTVTFGFSDSLDANTAPADPAPTLNALYGAMNYTSNTSTSSYIP
jgi:hypothetical protein